MEQFSPKLTVPDEKSSEVSLSGLYMYPIKSAGGIPIEAWDVDGRGLRTTDAGCS